MTKIDVIKVKNLKQTGKHKEEDFLSKLKFDSVATEGTAATATNKAMLNCKVIMTQQSSM